MNIEQLAERIAHPDGIHPQEFQMLRALCEKYPYAQTFPLLLLKGLAINKDLEFDEALHQYAYRIADREWLHELLEKNDSKSFDSEERIEEKSINPLESVEIESAPKVDEVEKESAEAQEDSNDTTDVQTESLTEAEEISPPTSPTQEESDDSEDQSDDLLQRFTAEAMGQVYHLESAVSEIEDSQTEIADENTEGPASKKQNEKEILSEDDGQNQAEKKTSVDAPKSFSDWMRMSKGQANKDESAHSEADKKEEATTKLVSEDEDLVVKFIQNEPKIERPKKNDPNSIKPKTPFYNPQEKARESIRSERMPVSETLAKIFAAQGDIPKAIRAYEQLCLIYPEKKSFFADQIQELKENK